MVKKTDQKPKRCKKNEKKLFFRVRLLAKHKSSDILRNITHEGV